jgi:hypothetical protein
LNRNETGLGSRCKLLPAVFVPAAFLYTAETGSGGRRRLRAGGGRLFVPPFSNGAIFRQNV